MQLHTNDLILFQGDSITDAGRDKEDSSHLGSGYARLVASMLGATHPELRPRFLNRGVSGNRTKDLVARWQDDCLAIKPDVLSIMIGINNVWRRYDQNDPTDVSTFETEYRSILVGARETGIREIMLLEPFIVPVSQEWEARREDLEPKIQVVRRLAREFEARLVALDGIFAAACTQAPPEYWAPDGVHPTAAGHGLIANAWLDATESSSSAPEQRRQ